MDDPIIDAMDLCPDDARKFRHKSQKWTVARAKADIVLCDMDAIKVIVNEGQAKVLVWEEEGGFLPNGDWEFNPDHQDFEPLLLDVNTARLLVSLYDRIEASGNSTKSGEPNYKAMARQLKLSRAYIVKYCEFVWKHAGF